MIERIDVFESYALYNNINDCIFLLNPIIEKYGYQFISIDLETLEKEFGGLFLRNTDLKTGNTVFFENANATLNEEFNDALLNVHPIGISILLQKKAYLLKKQETVERKVIDGVYTNGPLTHTM